MCGGKPVVVCGLWGWYSVRSPCHTRFHSFVKLSAIREHSTVRQAQWAMATDDAAMVVSIDEASSEASLT